MGSTQLSYSWGLLKWEIFWVQNPSLTDPVFRLTIRRKALSLLRQFYTKYAKVYEDMTTVRKGNPMCNPRLEAEMLFDCLGQGRQRFKKKRHQN